MKKKWLTTSNAFTALLILFVVAMAISPEVKGWTIQGLMKMGLFQPDVSQPRSATVAAELPPVVFQDRAGNNINLASLKGKVVFINFWATWCPPCIAEMPSIHALRKRWKGNEDVVFLMVDVDNNYEKSEKFMKKHKYDLEVVSPASKIPPVLMQGTIPTTVILDKNGQIAFRQEGAANYSSPGMVDLMNQLSRQTSP